MTIPKIDIHLHCTMYPEIALPNDDGTPLATPENVFQTYDILGISHGIILPLIGPECCRTLITSEEAYTLSRSSNGRLFWFCTMSPKMGHCSSTTDFSKYLMHYKQLGARGVGEADTNIPFDDPLTENLFAHCAACNMPVLFHVGASLGDTYGLYDGRGLYRLEKELKKFPDLTLIGHSCDFWHELTDGNNHDGRLFDLMRYYPNLYCDLSAGSGARAMMTNPERSFRFMEEFGDRLMFGTDIMLQNGTSVLAPWLDEMHELGNINDNVYAGICRKNAIRLLHLNID